MIYCVLNYKINYYNCNIIIKYTLQYRLTDFLRLESYIDIIELKFNKSILVIHSTPIIVWNSDMPQHFFHENRFKNVCINGLKPMA